MKVRHKLVTYTEVLLVIILFFSKILPDWYVANATAGDFFCLEVIGMFMYNIYDNIKNKG